RQRIGLDHGLCRFPPGARRLATGDLGTGRIAPLLAAAAQRHAQQQYGHHGAPFGNATTFYGAPGDVPDSLVLIDTLSTQWYRRHLKHGASVTFDAAGRHRFTTNRAGHRTLMTWTTVTGQARLASVAVPPTGASYLLNWNGTTGRLNFLQDPGGRQLTTVMAGANLVKVRAPAGLDSTRFAHDGRGVITARIATRQAGSTKGDSTRTTYTYGHNARVTQVAIQADSAGTAFATTTIAPWDEVGLTTLVLADTA